MTTTVYFRASDLDQEQELAVCSKYFDTIRFRTELLTRNPSLVIPRFSALPYYRELYADLIALECKPINTPKQFNWIADFQWYEQLSAYTFKTWTDLDFYEAPKNLAFVVKGRTNSRKTQWNTKCFAYNKQRALEIAGELANDPLIGPQGILYREYCPLVTYQTDEIYGLPYTNEWRVFYLYGQRIAHGYYWDCADKTDYELPNSALDFADKIAKIAAQENNFFCLDIAEKQSGGWVLVEINAGEQAGLSCIDSETFYSNLKLRLIDS